MHRPHDQTATHRVKTDPTSFLTLRRITWIVLGLLFAISANSGIGAWQRQIDDDTNSRSPSNAPDDEAVLLEPPLDTLPERIDWHETPLGLPDSIPLPEDITLDEDVVALGRKLFFDPLLSRDKTVSCASCHRPDQAFATHDKVAIGIDNTLGTRNSPTLLNVAYGESFFWDGRATTLEEQSLQPIENSLEMDFTVEGVMDRLQADEQYRADFERAFDDGLTRQNLAKSIAAFQRVLLSGNSPVDRFRASDFSALTDDQRKGMWLFESRGGCWRCHNGPTFSDNKFHNTGVSWGTGDTGRFLITSEIADLGKFKTPTLRHIAETAPYMHDGSIATLEEVVEYYNKGGNRNPHLDFVLKPLNLSEAEVGFLVAFLEALSSDYPGMPANDSTDR